jgi:CheY-like chemotaxis protein
VAVGVEIADWTVRSADWKGEGRRHSDISNPNAEIELHCTVRDTGVGIPFEKQQLIFEAFAQADGSTARRYGGSGLGLTISSQLVSLMGGRMWVESQPGKGSTFHFTVRCRRQSGRPQPPIPSELAYLRGLPVLVADDDATDRRTLEETLTHWSMQPTTVSSGKTALAIMERAQDIGKPFALILLDVQMPETDGFAIVEYIQHHPKLAGATIMVLGSDSPPEGRARCNELGVAAYLTKPVKEMDLLAALRATLGVQSAVTADCAASPPSVPSAAIHGRALRILVAEDNPTNQRLVARVLEKRGHTVVVAGNGRDALAAWEQDSFDVLLMDIQMPEMDGLQATAEIRAREARAAVSRQRSAISEEPPATNPAIRDAQSAIYRIPIIAVTAHASEGYRERCLAAGMDGYVAKPIEVKRLLAAIEAALTLRAARSAAGPSVAAKAAILE